MDIELYGHWTWHASFLSLILSVLKSSLNLFNQFSADTLDESGNLWHHLAFLYESANYKIKKCTFLTETLFVLSFLGHFGTCKSQQF